VTRGRAPLPGSWEVTEGSPNNEQSKRHDAILRFILEKRVKNVLLAARWSGYIERWSTADRVFLVDARTETVSREESIEVVRRRLDALVATLSDAGIKVWILKQVPEQDGLTAFQLLMNRRFCIEPHAGQTTIESHGQRQSGVNRAFAEMSADGAEILDPTSSCLDSLGKPVTLVNGRACYKDSNHLS
jgi:hypothetical protein